MFNHVTKVSRWQITHVKRLESDGCKNYCNQSDSTHRRAMMVRNSNSCSQIASSCKRRHSSSPSDVPRWPSQLSARELRVSRSRVTATRDVKTRKETRAVPRIRKRVPATTTHARNSSSLKCRRVPRGQRISAARYLPCNCTFTSCNTELQMPLRTSGIFILFYF